VDLVRTIGFSVITAEYLDQAAQRSLERRLLKVSPGVNAMTD